MQFIIQADMANGTNVFNATLTYLPRKDDRIEVGGYTFVVEKVTYVMQEGSYSGQRVKLLLKMV